jgi:cytosine/adenosine deaminase-related metal-dependent hydrolase
LGTLEAGKIADVVVWDGDPLELMSAPTAVLINGREVELTSRQTELRDRYLTLKRGELPVQYQR